MILAEMSSYDPPVMIGIVLACLMFLFVGGNAAAEFWRNIKDKPTGTEVLDKARKEFQPKGDYVTRHEFITHNADVGKLLDKISDENSEILVAGNDREKHLSEQIKVVQADVTALPGKITADLLNAKKLFQT